MKYILFTFSLILIGCSKQKKTENNLNLDSVGGIANTYLSKLTELKKFNGVILLKKKRN